MNPRLEKLRQEREKLAEKLTSLSRPQTDRP